MRPISGWVVLVNPEAGPAPIPAERVAEALARWEVPGPVDVVRGRAEMAEAVVAVARSGRRPTVVGGNGTVHVAVNALLEAGLDPTLGVLPGTSASDLMRTFGHPATIEAAAGRLRGDASYRIDVAVIEGEWGRRFVANAAQAGLGAAAARLGARLPRRLGTRRFDTGLALLLPTFGRASVVVDGPRRLEADALGVVLANGQFLGGGWNVAPKALLVDGELDVQIVTAAKPAAPRLAAAMRRGVHLPSPGIMRRTMSAARVGSSRPWPVEADGEVLGSTPFSVTVLPSALAIKI